MKWIKAKGSDPGMRYVINVEAVRRFEGRVTPAGQVPRWATVVAMQEEVEGRDSSSLYRTQSLPLATALLDALVAFLADPAATVFDVEAKAAELAGG